LKKVLRQHKISAYEMLAVRIDPEKIKTILAESARLHQAKLQAAAGITNTAGNTTANATATANSKASHTAAEITIDDFAKVDLRIARIVQAEEIKEADKLLRLQVDLGPLGQRQIIAGIRLAYKPENLVGRLTVVVANL